MCPDRPFFEPHTGVLHHVSFCVHMLMSHRMHVCHILTLHRMHASDCALSVLYHIFIACVILQSHRMHVCHSLMLPACMHSIVLVVVEEFA